VRNVRERAAVCLSASANSAAGISVVVTRLLAISIVLMIKAAVQAACACWRFCPRGSLRYQFHIL